MIDKLIEYSKQEEVAHSKFIEAAYQVATEQNLSSALYRLPEDATRHHVISFSDNNSFQDSVLEDLPSGFVFTKFNNESIYIKNDLHFTFGTNLNISLNPIIDSSDNDEAFFTRMDELLNVDKISPNSLHYLDEQKTHSTTKPEFIDYVQQSIEAINHAKFEKVVPARCQWINLPKDFNHIVFFDKLCSAYPTAMISMVSTPETGTWIGATPERLVSISKEKIFSTVALAGTQVFLSNMALVDVAWKQKEIEEQAIVNRYIIDCFKKIRLREFTEKGPRTSKAGNLIHLKTEFTVDMKSTNFGDLGSVMLDLLHPTSAVCGMPKKPALDFIMTHEKFDRSFFSGYLGPVNMENETNIFVNLRCMELFQDSALLFAGAGVTEDSKPENEWKETELKLQTLLNYI